MNKKILGTLIPALFFSHSLIANEDAQYEQMAQQLSSINEGNERPETN